jgi:hypothetical protein
LKKKENELLEIYRLLKQHFDQLQGLRIDLINNKIDAEVAINKLMNTNQKLVKEITQPKLVEAELKKI